MYRVVLINLSEDARTVAVSGNVELPSIDANTLRQLLENFAGIDLIENSTVDTEIRILVRGENYLVRTSQAKLVLYDMRHRELPGQIMTLTEILSELDGSAAAARNQSILQMRTEAESPVEETIAGPASHRRANSKSIPLLLIVGLLIAVNIEFAPRPAARFPENFTRTKKTEAIRLQASLTGVYLTGNDPGQHGIVLNGSDELKLFELGSSTAPRVVYATFAPGRIGTKLVLATDQPGGLIEIKNNQVLVYCGESYQRIP